MQYALLFSKILQLLKVSDYFLCKSLKPPPTTIVVPSAFSRLNFMWA